MNMVNVRVSDEWTCKIQNITPSMAADILKASNHDNRKLRRSVADRYAKIMRNGDWKLTPEPIILSDTGNLLNGQHRLTAVVLSNITSRFFFVRNVPDDVFSALDRGTPRTTADAIRAEKRLVECAKVMLAMSGNGVKAVTDDEVKRLIDIIGPKANKLFDHCGTAARVFSSAPYRSAAVLRMMKDGHDLYIMDMYRDIVLSHVHNLPPIGQALIGAAAKGSLDRLGGYSRQKTDLAMAWHIFDIRKSSFTRLPRPNIETTIGEVNDFIASIVRDSQ